jgi:hypothetical protein
MRTRVRTRRALLAGLLTLLLTPLATRAFGGTEPATPAATRPYTVAAGDTYWSIARHLAGPQADPRPVVDHLRALNDVDPGSLTVGSRLLVPASL